MEQLPDIQTDFSGWYNTIITRAQLVDDSPTKGTMVIRPYGYAIWENIQKILNKKLKEHGVENAYFPLLIPMSFLTKEKKHVEGFSPELAVVTHAGGKKLTEQLVVRPTSETIIYHMFSRWIKSWRDLPLKINQWANVVRWEMRTRPFLRTSEFLWQEGHTAHIEQDEAISMAKTILNIYCELVEDYLAIPVITGEKSKSEKFAGADHTFTFEGMMQDGKALQMGTSHLLAQSFPKNFGVEFQNKDGSMQIPYCTSWGVSTRLIGALIMVHGDQTGLIMPPKIASIIAVIIPIYKKEEERGEILNVAEKVKTALKLEGLTTYIDDDESVSPGAKFYKWEMKGVPIRIEIGSRDIEKQQAVLVNRVEINKKKRKTFVSLDKIAISVSSLCENIQNQLFQRAKKFKDEKWNQVDKLSEFGSILDEKNGFYQTGWCGSNDCEEKLHRYKGTIRCLIEDNQHDTCFNCEQKSKNDVVVAKAY